MSIPVVEFARSFFSRRLCEQTKYPAIAWDVHNEMNVLLQAYGEKFSEIRSIPFDIHELDNPRLHLIRDSFHPTVRQSQNFFMRMCHERDALVLEIETHGNKTGKERVVVESRTDSFAAHYEGLTKHFPIFDNPRLRTEFMPWEDQAALVRNLLAVAKQWIKR